MISDAKCGCRYHDHGRGSGSLTSGVWAGSKGLAHTLFYDAKLFDALGKYLYP